MFWKQYHKTLKLERIISIKNRIKSEEGYDYSESESASLAKLLVIKS